MNILRKIANQTTDNLVISSRYSSKNLDFRWVVCPVPLSYVTEWDSNIYFKVYHGVCVVYTCLCIHEYVYAYVCMWRMYACTSVWMQLKGRGQCWDLLLTPHSFPHIFENGGLLLNWSYSVGQDYLVRDLYLSSSFCIHEL